MLPCSTPCNKPPAAADQGEQWDAKVKNILKAELKRKGVSYKELADRLAAHRRSGE